eukprot:scaffold312_cov409-Pavlova_lutheri.AAC.14
MAVINIKNSPRGSPTRTIHPEIFVEELINRMLSVGNGDAMAIPFELKTRMKAAKKGVYLKKGYTTASFNYTLPFLDVNQTFAKTRGLYLDGQFLENALNGGEPEASLLKMHLGEDSKNIPVATNQHLRILKPLLPWVIKANTLQPSEKLHDTCAVVGNSWRLLQCRFGESIDRHDAVLRINDARIRKFAKWVGSKTTYRVMNRAAKRRVENSTMIMFNILQKDVHFMARYHGSSWFVLRKPLPYINMYKTFKYSNMTLPLVYRSTGMLALRLAIDLCNHTTAYGFTIEEEKTYGHYYTRSSQKAKPEFPKIHTGGHDLLTHRAFFLFCNCSELVRFPKC